FARRLAGNDELPADVVGVTGWPEAAADLEDGILDGRHDTVAEGLQQDLVAQVLDLVVVELAQRGADGGTLLDLAGDRVHDQQQGKEDGGSGEQLGHWIMPRCRSSSSSTRTRPGPAPRLRPASPCRLPR